MGAWELSAQVKWCSASIYICLQKNIAVQQGTGQCTMDLLILPRMMWLPEEPLIGVYLQARQCSGSRPRL